MPSLSNILASGKMGFQRESIDIDFNNLVVFTDPNGVTNPSIVDETDPEFVALVKNIRERGLDNPIIVRPLKSEEGKYQILCGHHRVAACKILSAETGMTTIRAYVKNIDDDDAALLVATDNFNHKKNYKPSEKAKFYKMALDAMQRKAGRKMDGNDSEGRAVETLAAIVSESQRSIMNYVRLTYLIPEFLNLVDDKKQLKLIPAVDLSYLPEKYQRVVYETVFDNDELGTDISLSASQTKRIRERAERFDITPSWLLGVVNVEPKTKKTKLNRSVSKLLPPNIKKPDDIDNYLIEAIRYYQSHIKDIESQGE